MVKTFISRAAAEEIHMLKLNEEKQEQMFQDARDIKKYEYERGIMRMWKVANAWREIK